MPKIGLVGGTGGIGSALAVHLAKKNRHVLIGSRSKEKAESAVREVLKDKNGRKDLEEHLEAVTNDVVVSTCDTIIVTVPYSAAIETITKLRDEFKENQLLISTVAAIEKSRSEFVPIEHATSISKNIRDIVPKSVLVATAFQTIPAIVLYKEEKIDADVLVSCDERETYMRTAEIVSSIEGLRPLYAGSLDLSAEIEGLTALLLNISIHEHLKNPTFKIHSF
jgi:8-hydroxy-5-deazaflavin:NADPH oxidoreductase